MRSLDKTFFTFPKSKPEKRCNTGTFPNHPKPAMPFFSRTISTVKSPSGGILRYAAIVAQDGTPKLWLTPRPEQRTEVPQNSSLNEGGWDPTATENIRFHDVSRLFALKLRKVFCLPKMNHVKLYQISMTMEGNRWGTPLGWESGWRTSNMSRDPLRNVRPISSIKSLSAMTYHDIPHKSI